MAKFLAAVMTLLLHALRATLRSRADVGLENLALRQPVMVLKEKRPRPSLDDGHRAFWVALRSVWSLRTKLLVIVDPDPVVRWHRTRFRCHWTKLSQRHRRPGRPRIDADIRKLMTPYPVFQRYVPSDVRMGHPAAARGVSLRHDAAESALRQ